MKSALILALGILSYSSSARAFTLISNLVTSGWNTETLVFDVNETSCSALGISVAELEADLDAAIELWNRAPTSKLKLARGTAVTATNTGTNPPHLVCNSGVITSPDVVPGEAAGIAVSGGRPVQGYIQINGDQTRAAYFGNLTATQAQIVLAHEMGHILGLGHAENDYALMYYDISAKTNLNLSQDDIDGISWLNPRDETQGGLFGCGTLMDLTQGPPPPGGGLGASLGGMMSLLLFFGFAFGVSRRLRPE
jgi:hypothetical protein